MECVNCGAKITSVRKNAPSAYQQTNSGHACPVCHMNPDFSFIGEKLFGFGLTVFIFGLVWLVLLWGDGYQNLKGSFLVSPKDYLTTSGYINKSQLVEKSHRGKTHYVADISYLYKVDDEIYESNQIIFKSEKSSERERMAELVAKYPVKSNVTVFYKNNEADFSVLEPSVTLDTRWVFKYYGSLFLLGIAVISWKFVQFKKAKKRPPVKSKLL